MARKAKSDPGLSRAMRDSLKAYAAGSERFFGYLDEGVRVYTLEAAQPIVGRKAFQTYFGPTFRKTKRKVATVAQDVQLSGNQAVLAQTLEITANGVGAYVRQTVIWNKSERGAWRMSHIHNAAVGEPVQIGRPPTTAAGIRVLNERIATVAATVGMAQ